MKAVAAYFVISGILALASIHVVDAASIRASDDFVPGKQADGFIKEEQDIRRLQDPVSPVEMTLVDWPPPYLVKYRRAMRPERVGRCTAFLENRGIMDPPHEGTKCHKRKKGDYKCLVGIQTCSDGEEHPQKICSCDTTDGMLTCDYWNPCDGEADSQTWEQEKAPETFTFEPPEYWREYRSDPALEAYNFQPCGFLVLRNIDNPKDGDRCHPRKDGDYTCTIGKQERECPDLSPPITIHPKRICMCDVASKRLTCSDWTAPPCPEPPMDEIPPETPVDEMPPEPPVDEIPPEPPVDEMPPEPPVDEVPPEPPMEEPARCPEPDSGEDLDCTLAGAESLMCDIGTAMCADCDGVEQAFGPRMTCSCLEGQQVCTEMECPDMDCSATCPSNIADLDCSAPGNDGLGCEFGRKICQTCDGNPTDLGPLDVCSCVDGELVCAPQMPCSPLDCLEALPPEEPHNVCEEYTSCEECLSGGCAFFGDGMCAADCNMIQDDARCYFGDAAQQCLAMEEAEMDAQACKDAGVDCETCTSEIQPNSGLPCLWLDFGDGSGSSCESSCGMFGCGLTDGSSCPEPNVGTNVEPATCPESPDMLDCALPGHHGLICEFGRKVCQTTCDGDMVDQGPLQVCGCEGSQMFCQPQVSCGLLSCPELVEAPPGEVLTATCPGSEEELNCAIPENDGIWCEFGDLVCTDCNGVEQHVGPLLECVCESGIQECLAPECPLFACPVGEPVTCPDSEAELDCSIAGTDGLWCEFGEKMCTDCDGVEQPSGPLMECGCQNGNLECRAEECPLNDCPEQRVCPDTLAELDCTQSINEGIQCNFGTMMCANDCSGVESPSGPAEHCQCQGGMSLCAQSLCPQVLCEIQAIAIDGRPFIDHEGTMKMARTVEVNDGAQPALWSKASSPAGVTTFVSEGRRLELVDEWKRRAVGEHSSIASFAAFAIALMTNQAPPDLVQASLVAAMDELRHAQTSFEMLSLLLGGSVVEPSSLPASKHEFQQNLSTLASGVAQEGCVDETLSALVLAASVDQLQDESRVDPTLQLLAEKTTQIAKEEGSHSVLAWRTIHWVCSMEEKEACDAVLNKWFEEGRLANSGDARLDADDESSMKAWRFIYKQLVPLVTASEEKPVGESLLLDDDGSLVTSLANDIVSGVRAAVTATDEVVQTFSSPTTMNCSSGSSEEEEALRMETLPMQLAGESVALGA